MSESAAITPREKTARELERVERFGEVAHVKRLWLADGLVDAVGRLLPEYDLLRDCVERIANEPPNRGLTPDFRRFATDALALIEEMRRGG